MSSSTHPVFVLAVLGLVGAVIMLITVFRVYHRGLKAMLLLIALAMLTPAGLVLMALYPEWTDARIRTYKDFYEDLHLGMTRAEVMEVKARLYPVDGPRKVPTIIAEDETSLSFFMHPEDETEPNCEGILLTFAEGKLKSKIYSPD